jgi:thioredoxin 1
MATISRNEFDELVKKGNGVVLVDFFAPWCGPCKMLTPILEEIQKERPDLKIVKVDVDEEPDLAREHNVMSVPTMILYQNGKIKKNWVGLRSKPVLLQEIEEGLQA